MDIRDVQDTLWELAMEEGVEYDVMCSGGQGSSSNWRYNGVTVGSTVRKNPKRKTTVLSRLYETAPAITTTKEL